jgi:hypothetical protein
MAEMCGLLCYRDTRSLSYCSQISIQKSMRSVTWQEVKITFILFKNFWHTLCNLQHLASNKPLISNVARDPKMLHTSLSNKTLSDQLVVRNSRSSGRDFNWDLPNTKNARVVTTRPQRSTGGREISISSCSKHATDWVTHRVHTCAKWSALAPCSNGTTIERFLDKITSLILLIRFHVSMFPSVSIKTETDLSYALWAPTSHIVGYTLHRLLKTRCQSSHTAGWKLRTHAEKSTIFILQA